MIIIRNLKTIQLPPTSLTIGNFDGVHFGHLNIINHVKKIAKENNLASAILTFTPHPENFFSKQKEDFLITNLAKKLEIFSENKIDYAIVLPFNQALSQVSANDFINDILLKKINTKFLTIGHDFSFGKNREGNISTLQKFDFPVTQIAAIKKDGQLCSSSNVRKLIAEGLITDANKILNYNFSIEGQVEHGRKLAASLGFPTLNIKPKPHIIKPKFGVYKTSTYIPHLDQKLPSITNFGIKPTLQNNFSPLFETHIPNFNQEIYGTKVIVEFIDFIRPEIKFSSLEELKSQIELDVSNVL